MASALVLGLLGFFALLVLVSTVLVLGHRVPFRLAMRNVRRGRWRTVLIVLGLLIGTTIISGALVINDTVAAVNVHFTYQAYGYTDEAVYNGSVSSVTAAFQPFPSSVYTNLSAAADSNSLIAGTTPELILAGSAYDRTSGVPESGIQVVGANSNESVALGPFTYDNGTTTAGPAPGTVLLDDQLASNLGASAGDRVVLYGVASSLLVVQGIVQDDVRGGFFGGNTAFVTLPTAQSIGNLSGQINFIAITNVGSLTAGVGHSGAVSAFLNSTLVAMGSPYGLAAYPILQNALTAAENSGTSITTLFLVLGLFSILAGALLIVGIFIMLAQERQGEMGMLRAVGLTRRGLVYVYFFEGLVYAGASSLVGTFLGVGVGYVLLRVYLGSGAVTARVANAVFQSFTVSTSSLLIAFVAGFTLTIVTIAVASLRVSRLNIVRAIRSIPEPPPTRRWYTWLAVVGVVLLLLGGLLFLRTRAGTGDVSYPLLGLGLAVLGGAFVASRFFKNRYVYSAAGLLLLIWGGSTQVHSALLGSAHSGTIFAVFVLGIEMIGGIVLLFVFNSDLIAAGLGGLVGRSSRALPVARVGLGYPQRNAARSAVNFAIFAMVIFTVVIVASYGAAVTAGLSNSVEAESGGYSFFGYTSNSAPGLPAAIQNNSTLRSEVSVAVPLVVGNLELVRPGGPYVDTLYAPNATAPAGENFFATNAYNFTATWHGLSSSAVWNEVRTNDSVAVVDSQYQAASGVNVGGGGHPTLPLGTVAELRNPSTGSEANVTVIAYLSQTILSGFWLNDATAAILGYGSVQGFLFTVAPGASTTTASQDLKRAFFPEGLVLYDFAQILQNAIQSTEGIIGLLEIFVALGLAVGIAGMGIIALRAVTERRMQIGMLRATGFTRLGILASFLVEYSYIVLLGSAAGTGLAVWLYYDASAENSGAVFGVFAVPTATILTIVLLAYGLTLLAVVGPSWKAATLPPAEAVRYTE